MPIDQQLENIEVPEKKPENTNIIEAPKTSTSEILRSYVRDIVLLHNQDYVNITPRSKGHCTSSAIENYLPWLRFKPGLLPGFNTITKTELIDLVSLNDPDLGLLYRKTDFSDLLPERFNIESPLIITTNIDDQLELAVNQIAVQHFVNSIGQNYFSIPNYKFLSLFVAEGDKLNQCAQQSNWGETIKYLEINQFMRRISSPDKRVPSINELIVYSERNSISELKDMYLDLSDLLKVFQSYKDTILFDTLRNILFTRLKKYHPELILQEV